MQQPSVQPYSSVYLRLRKRQLEVELGLATDERARQNLSAQIEQIQELRTASWLRSELTPPIR